MKGAFAYQPPDSRRLGPSRNGRPAVLGIRAFHPMRRERRRILRRLRVVFHHQGGPQSERQRRKERVVVREGMVSCLPVRRMFLRPFIQRVRLFFGDRIACFRSPAGKRVEHCGEGEAVRWRVAGGARRGRRGWRRRERGGRRGHGGASILRGSQARRALKRVLGLRDRQRWARGLVLAAVGQGDGVLRIEGGEVWNDPQLRRHPSSRGQQAGVAAIEFGCRQSTQIGDRGVVCVRE